MKNSVNKNDKKKRKEVLAQIDELQEQLKRQQIQEIEELEAKYKVEDVSNETSVETQIENVKETEEVCGLKYTETRVSKAQRKKDKKTQKEKERLHRIETEDVSHLNHSKMEENESIGRKIKELELKIFDIPSDGNCLYRAVEHQLKLQGNTTSVLELRNKTAEFIRQNKDRFLPFLINEQTGDMMTEEEVENYCHEVESTSAWGGNLELQSLAQALQRRINVVQSEGPILTFGEEFPLESKIILSYHRHAFSLGEHYNSLIPFDKK